MSRLLVLGLDGIEISFAEQLMAAGEMPALRSLRQRGGQVLLEHGAATRTGLAWEHFSSGKSPEQAGRWSAVEFDPTCYRMEQQGARLRPFFADLPARTVVFDPPYTDLGLCPGVRGLVGWGAHDPGVAPTSSPPELLGELPPYPAGRWTYGLPWGSAGDCEAMGRGLVEGLEVRTRLGRQLMTERFPDWEVFVAVSGELHGAIEGMWHGVDPEHPLHSHPSAPAAREALVAIHRAVDDLVAALVEAAGPDCTVLAFNMNGMGSNNADLPSMVLLSELVHRWCRGAPRMVVPEAWRTDGPPGLEEGQSWTQAIAACHPDAPVLHRPRAPPRRPHRPLITALGQLWSRARSTAGEGEPAEVRELDGTRPRAPLDWMPASWYQRHWSGQDAFVVPSFYDGQLRVNLEGREARGRVSLERFPELCDQLEAMLFACRDPATGEPVVAEVVRATAADPLGATGTQADLVVVWRGNAQAFEHPELGVVGPVPYRRTGGHTGPHGVAVAAGPGIPSRLPGSASSFEVAPAVAWLAGGARGTPPPLLRAEEAGP